MDAKQCLSYGRELQEQEDPIDEGTITGLFAHDSAARQKDRAFLERFEPSVRSHLTNLFLKEIRDGMGDPQDVVRRVCCHARAKSLHSFSHSDQIKFQAYATAIEAHPEEAILFAMHCLAREALPHEEKKRQKAERTHVHRAEWMRRQPPTESQIRYLRRLGHRGDITDKQHASDLITRYVRGER